MFKPLVSLALLLGLSCPSYADPAVQAWTAAGADTATTAAGLAAGLTELNPLGPVGAIVVKVAAMGYIGSLPEEDRAVNYNLVSSFWGGASVNNLCWLTGAGPACLLLGLGAGRWMWNASEAQRQTALASKRRSEVASSSVEK